MNEYLLIKFAHIVAFVYWLGGDLGTFIASRQVVNADNSPEARNIALKIMLACDMGPKLAMPLIFPMGLHLAHMLGAVEITTAVLVAVWAISLYWFTIVLTLYLNEGKPFTAGLAKTDFYFRLGVVALLVIYGTAALVTEGATADWIAWKILVFAALVSCGIGIRVNLKPFLPAFVEMMSKGPSDAGNIAMAQSISRCRPYVWCIWAGLFINAALGTRLLG
jgi:hypothetical protein